MMRRLIVTAALVPALAAAARAEEWVPVGPSAIGQGGAGVAAAEGPGMTYWNPALPGLGKMEGPFDLGSSFGLGLDFSASLSAEGDVVKQADEVYDLIQTTDFNAIQTRLNAGTATVARSPSSSAIQSLGCASPNAMNRNARTLARRPSASTATTAGSGSSSASTAASTGLP